MSSSSGTSSLMTFEDQPLPVQPIEEADDESRTRTLDSQSSSEMIRRVQLVQNLAIQQPIAAPQARVEEEKEISSSVTNNANGTNANDTNGQIEQQ